MQVFPKDLFVSGSDTRILFEFALKDVFWMALNTISNDLLVLNE